MTNNKLHTVNNTQTFNVLFFQNNLRRPVPEV